MYAKAPRWEAALGIIAREKGAQKGHPEAMVTMLLKVKSDVRGFMGLKVILALVSGPGGQQS